MENKTAMTRQKMAKLKTKPIRKEQLGKADWINAAKTMLIKQGIAEVKIEKIAAKLKVTIGSFYWHFSGRPALYDAISQKIIDNSHKRPPPVPPPRRGPKPSITRLW